MDKGVIYSILIGLICFIVSTCYSNCSEYSDKVKEIFEPKVYFPDMEFRKAKESGDD